MYAATRGSNVKLGGTDFKWWGRAPLDPRWRRPCREYMSQVTIITVYTILLLSLIFAQDVYKRSNSSKDSRISINCQETRTYESKKCNHPMYFNERQHRN